MKNGILLLIFMTVTCILHAQSINFSLEIEKDTVKIGDLVTVTYKLSGARGDFHPPDLAGLRLVGGPNYSSEISIVNGNMDQTFTYSYIFQFTEEGIVDIPEASVTIDGKDFYSPTASIYVTDNPNWNPSDKKDERPDPTRKKLDKNVTRI